MVILLLLNVKSCLETLASCFGCCQYQLSLECDVYVNISAVQHFDCPGGDTNGDKESILHTSNNCLSSF